MNTTEQNAAKNTEAQVRRVLDVMNQGKLKQAIRITATPIAAAVAEDRLQVRGSAVPACRRIRADKRIRPTLRHDRAD